MRLSTVRLDDARTTAAISRGGRLFPIDSADVGTLLADPNREHVIERAATASPLEPGFSLAPVIPNPGKIICCGINYLSHVQEMGRETPRFPTLFAKFASTLCGSGDAIPVPSEADADWEVELAVVVGTTIQGADRAEAVDAIAGYTVANDFSMRRWQGRTLQWMQGKTWDATTPLGPALVTPDEVDVPAGVAVTCTVNGTVMQRGSTADLIFDPAELIAYISTFATLHPGDVVLTGTPGGVGAGRRPKVFLAPGDLVESSIAGLGSFESRIIAAGGPA